MAVSSTGSRLGRRGIVFGAIAVGIGLLAGSLFLPWYSVALPPALEGGMERGSGSYLESWGPWSVSYQFPAVLGNPCAGAAPTQNCSTPPSTWSTTFGRADLSDLSGLYLIAAGLALAAAVLGGVALFVRYIARGISPRVRTLTVGTLLAIAVLFAVAAPTFVALHQPATVCTDWTGSGPVPLGPSPAAGSSAAGCGWAAVGPGGGPTLSRGPNTPMGPGDSFVGSNASAGTSWGPALGWFLPLLAGGTFAAALAIELLAPRRGTEHRFRPGQAYITGTDSPRLADGQSGGVTPGLIPNPEVKPTGVPRGTEVREPTGTVESCQPPPPHPEAGAPAVPAHE